MLTDCPSVLGSLLGGKFVSEKSVDSRVLGVMVGSCIVTVSHSNQLPYAQMRVSEKRGEH